MSMLGLGCHYCGKWKKAYHSLNATTVEFVPQWLCVRYGLVVRIPGSHPGGPGSIPGNGIFFKSDSSTRWVKTKNCVGRESNPDQLLGRQLCWPLYHRRRTAVLMMLVVSLSLYRVRNRVFSCVIVILEFRARVFDIFTTRGLCSKTGLT